MTPSNRTEDTLFGHKQKRGAMAKQKPVHRIGSWTWPSCGCGRIAIAARVQPGRPIMDETTMDIICTRCGDDIDGFAAFLEDLQLV